MRTRNVHRLNSSTFCQSHDHQRRAEGPSDAVADPVVNDRGLRRIAFIATSTARTLANPRNNPDGTCTLTYGHDRVVVLSAPPASFSVIGVTGVKQSGHVGTINDGVGTAGLLPHSDAPQLRTHTCGPSIWMRGHTLGMLAPGDTKIAERENANAHSLQRRNCQACNTTGATVATPGFLAPGDSTCIMDESSSAVFLRPSDLTTVSPGVSVTALSGIHVMWAAVTRRTPIARSPVGPMRPVGRMRESGDGDDAHVAHPSEVFVKTRQNTEFRFSDDLVALSICPENIPRFYLSPPPKEDVPTLFFPQASPLQYHLGQQQQQHGSSTVVMTRSVIRMPTKPLAQHRKSGRPKQHTAGYDG